MKYPLDVNLLVALGNGAHTSHNLADRWLKKALSNKYELGLAIK